MSDVLQIAVGVLRRGDEVLLALRQAKQDHANHWEFPGGKIEAGETVLQALVREFEEEVGVTTSAWRPLISIPWQYEKIAVHLQVYETSKFEGEPHGAEGQQTRWVSIEELGQFPFPKANQGIVTALQLPETYVISGAFHDEHDALNRLQAALEEGERLIQLRAKQMDEVAFLALAKPMIALAHQYGAKVLINGKPSYLDALPEADGLQLASSAMFDFTERPIAQDKLLSVSTHNAVEMAKALELGADMLLLSPVNETQSHPDMAGMGWESFAELCAAMPVPVYALGGMKLQDMEQARLSGAQGIAAISGLWPQPI